MSTILRLAAGIEIYPGIVPLRKEIETFLCTCQLEREPTTTTNPA